MAGGCIVPRAPGLYAFAVHGTRMGFTLVLDCADEVLRKCQQVVEAQGTPMLHAVIGTITSKAAFVCVEFVMLVHEFARRFAVRPVTGTNPQDYVQLMVVLRATRCEDGSWRTAAPCTPIVSTQPCHAPGSNNGKHCNRFTGPDFGKMCERACRDAGCTGPACRSGFKRLWCSDCDVSCYCSTDCMQEASEAHQAICKKAQAQRALLGFARCCSVCGLPDGTGGCKMLRCSGCKAVRYCSKECAARGWKAGHKEHCAAKKKKSTKSATS